MRSIRIAAPAAVMAVAAIGLAAPAAAELTDGTYQVTWDTGETKTWVITSCGEGCKSVSVDGISGGEYRLQGNAWTKITPSGVTVYSIDDTTLAGAVGMVDGETTGTYQLVKVG
jgi:hypothetical protein